MEAVDTGSRGPAVEGGAPWESRKGPGTAYSTELAWNAPADQLKGNSSTALDAVCPSSSEGPNSALVSTRAMRGEEDEGLTCRGLRGKLPLVHHRAVSPATSPDDGGTARGKLAAGGGDWSRSAPPEGVRGG